MEICPVGAELLHADGQTDGHDEAHTEFQNFSNASRTVLASFFLAVCMVLSQLQ